MKKHDNKDWAAIEQDRQLGMTVADIRKKYNISDGAIRYARSTGKLNDHRDRASVDWNAVQQCLDTDGVRAALLKFNTTMASLYTAKQKGKIHWSTQKSLKNRTPIDWNEIQQFYDDNNSTVDIVNQFNISYNVISAAVKNKDLILRAACERERLKVEKLTATMGGSLKWNNAKKKQHSIRMKEAVTQNPLSYSASNVSGRVKSYTIETYSGEITKVMGSWELLVATLLNKNNIHWTNELTGFHYSWNNNTHLYFPDFYLPKYDLYIEVKGFERERDLSKWAHFPHKLLIWRE